MNAVVAVQQDVEFDWEQFSACRGIGPRLFFPVEGESLTQMRNREAEAKKICADCAVREPCLATALLRDDYGIWGGYNSQERDALRGRRARRNRK